MWTYLDKPMNKLSDFPDNAKGFVYLIEFSNGKKYIGKKNLRKTSTLPALKNGTVREGAIQVVKIVNHKKVKKDIVTRESDWFTYTGSSTYCAGLVPVKKTILAIAQNDYELTYLEIREQCIHKVLEKEEFINANILAKFFKGRFGNLLNNLEVE